MEGGIEYLKEVIINDILDINAELERAMQVLVDNYKCEWKEVVDNPELQKRFNHFVNAPKAKDPMVTFETLRDQKKVADWNKKLIQTE
jgi:nitrite reductase (NADH) large subunit